MAGAVAAIATSNTPTAVLPAHTIAVRPSPFLMMPNGWTFCESATAIETVTVFQTKKTNDAAPSASHVVGRTRL